MILRKRLFIVNVLKRTTENLFDPSLQASLVLFFQCAEPNLDENAIYTERQNIAALSTHMFSCLFIPEITHNLSMWRGVSRDGGKPAHIQL